MRKASQILYLVGAIISIVWAAMFLLCGIAFIVLGAVCVGHEAEFIKQAVEQMPELEGKLTIEMVDAVIGSMIGCGVWFILEAGLCGVGSFFAFKANKEGSRGLAITNIVFGILGVTFVPAVGGVFNLIADQNEDNQKVEEVKE